MRLYLGLDPPDGVVHYPVIRIEPLEISHDQWKQFPHFTHILFTSKTTVKILSPRISHGKKLLAVGTKTAAAISKAGYAVAGVARVETQEGMIELLRAQELEKSYVLYPRSSLARTLLQSFLCEQGIRHEMWDLYTTLFQKPLPVPDFNLIDEIIFTSPSTVRGFIAAFGTIPSGKKLTCLGPVTEAELVHVLV
jgi:uroporphyrinogen-III synthase